MDSVDSSVLPVEAAPRARSGAGTLATVARWILGGAFLYMGMHKVLDPVGFLKLVHQYKLTTNPLILDSIAAALPWFEVFCGFLLVAGIAVRGAALVTLAMLLPFSLIVLKRALVMASTQGLAFCAVQFDCGCGNGEVVICHKLIENCALMLVSFWLFSGHGRKLSLRYSLLPTQS
jgi:uncharacterized membrane protein YphA (DoxX/SURF4 family)